MKNNKGLVIALAVAITLISAYQLYFTFSAKNADDKLIEQPALAFAQDAQNEDPSISDKQRDSIYKIKKETLTREVRTDKVSIFGHTYQEVKKKELNLGLDLQGGIHITLIVSPEGILKSLAGKKSLDAKFNKALVDAKAAQRNSGEKYTSLFNKAYKEAGGGELKELFFNLSNEKAYELTNKSTDTEIIDLIDGQLKDVIDLSLTILRNRIDAFGATSPIINAIESTGRIEIELPGVDDIEKVKKQIVTVAKLEFVEVLEAQKSLPVYYQVAEQIKVQEEKLLKTISDKKQAPLVQSSADEKLFDDTDTTGKSEDALFEGEDKVDSTALVNQNKDVNQSVAEILSGSREGLFYTSTKRENDLKRYLKSLQVKRVIPDNISIMLGKDEETDREGKPLGYKRVYFVLKGARGKVLLDGKEVDESSVTRDEVGGVAVAMSMSTSGTRKWAKITKEFSESPTPRFVAVVLDDVVYSAPRVGVEIKNGSSIISGNFDFKQASQLVSILKAGRLPATTEIERIMQVGASLGEAAVSRGLMSLLVGLGLVIIFMVVYYNKGGIVANIALLFNLFFIVGILATPELGVTLTLAGIAGIVLTIGMSIDANVLIFERIREELKIGRNMREAIDEGYSKAIWTILDANVTTLISAIILYSMGSGLIKGFAVTLIIGIFCSFLSAVFITRLIIEFWLGNKEDSTLSFDTGLSKKLFQNVSINFLGKRKIAYLISGLVITTGIVLMSINGLNYGVAFSGGYRNTVVFEQDVNVEAARKALKTSFGEASVDVKTIDSDNQLLITTTYMIDSDDANADSLVSMKLDEGLSKLGISYSIEGRDVVSASIADDIVKDSQIAIVLSLIAIFLYILVRFGKKQFGYGAIVALFHDVMVVLSVFAIARVLGFSFEIEEAFVAAILTIVGYSINDTVVVFDRIRDYVKSSVPTTKAEYETVVGKALNDTLSRTLMTSVTTLIVILVLLIFGGDVLRGFSFALFIGVLVGTYSSVFIATPVVVDTTSEESLKPKVKEAEVVA